MNAHKGALCPLKNLKNELAMSLSCLFLSSFEDFIGGFERAQQLCGGQIRNTGRQQSGRRIRNLGQDVIQAVHSELLLERMIVGTHERIS